MTLTSSGPAGLPIAPLTQLQTYFFFENRHGFWFLCAEFQGRTSLGVDVSFLLLWVR